MELSIVVIGLNEEQHLPACLASAVRAAAEFRGDAEVLYVDSGSTDGSLAIARAQLHVRVLRLAGEPNAARARNFGIGSARGRLVQLLDGDMELHYAWVTTAASLLDSTDLGAVGGIVRERHLGQSIWNMAFGLDWEAQSSPHRPLGGAALWRRQTLLELGGFDERLGVGEDPELCARARRAGHRTLYWETPMANHDLGLHSCGDWFRRGCSVGRSRANVLCSRPQGATMGHACLSLLWPWLLFPTLWGLAQVLGTIVWPACALAAACLVLRRIYRDNRQGLTWWSALVHGLHVYAVRAPIAFGAARGLLSNARGSTS